MLQLFSYMNHYKIGENKEITYIDGRQTLGSGIFANVYEGYKSNNINQRYAVKKIFRKHINQDRQIQTLKKLEHDNVIKFFQSYKNLHSTYIITELCDKENLKQVIQKQKGFNQEKVMDYSYQILCGIYYLHYKLKVMHRDLKTQNILLKDGKIKIADFGCSKDIDSDLDILRDLKQSNNVGTPIYCSPQLTHQQPYSAKCDVWSIGCIIYEMITGQKLFPYEKTEQLIEDQQNQRYINKIKEKLRDKNEFWTQLLIDKMLVYQEKSRSSVEQLFREISVEREKENYRKLMSEGEQKIKELENKLSQQTALKLKWKSDYEAKKNKQNCQEEEKLLSKQYMERLEQKQAQIQQQRKTIMQRQSQIQKMKQQFDDKISNTQHQTALEQQSIIQDDNEKSIGESTIGLKQLQTNFQERKKKSRQQPIQNRFTYCILI